MRERVLVISVMMPVLWLSCQRCAGVESGLRDETVLLHLAPEGDGADLQRVGGLTAIAAKTLERTLDHGSFLRLKIEAVVRRTLACLLRDLGRQFADLDAGPASNDDGAFDGVLELSNVARPTVVHQGSHGFRRDRLHVLLHARGRPSQEVVDQRRNVLAARRAVAAP